MSVKLLTEHCLEFLSLKLAVQAHVSLHMSNRHIVGNHMSRLIYVLMHPTGLLSYLLQVNQISFFDTDKNPENLIWCVRNLWYSLLPIT